MYTKIETKQKQEKEGTKLWIVYNDLYFFTAYIGKGIRDVSYSKEMLLEKWREEIEKGYVKIGEIRAKLIARKAYYKDKKVYIDLFKSKEGYLYVVNDVSRSGGGQLNKREVFEILLNYLVEKIKKEKGSEEAIRFLLKLVEEDLTGFIESLESEYMCEDYFGGYIEYFIRKLKSIEK
jgi:hypothetical protein